MRSRRGAGRIGCLFILLIVTALGYFGAGIGEVYWNFYKYQDCMKGEAQFAANKSDAAIKERIASFADSLGLPYPANKVIIRRGTHEIFIYANYDVDVDLPGRVKELHFNPSASGTF